MRIEFAEFVMIWNLQQGLTMPGHHVRIARWFQSCWVEGRRQLLLMAFRNSGKSTLVGLFCAWLLMSEPDTRILVMAADFALAKKMVRNVKRILERHPLTGGLKPDRRDQWASDQFTVNRPGELRDPSMLARGIGSNITGSRADVVICDDVEVPNTCDTAPKRDDLRARLNEIEFVIVPGGLQLYVGTPHTYYTIYADEPRLDAGEETIFLEGFDRFVLPLVNGLGDSTWPERFPKDKIDSLRKRSGQNRFESQMMLRPLNIMDGRLDPDRVRIYDADLDYKEHNGVAELTLNGHKLVSATCWWDPSFGAPEKGDSSVIACVFTDETGGYWLHRIRYLTFNPRILDKVDEATQLCRQVTGFLKVLHLPSVIIETNGVGKFLPGLLRRELSMAKMQVSVLEETSRKNKDMRILEAFDVALAAGSIHAHKSILETPFMTEMRDWVPGRSKSRDDGLDAVAGCLLSEPVRLSRLPMDGSVGRAAWATGSKSFDAGTDFEL